MHYHFSALKPETWDGYDSSPRCTCLGHPTSGLVHGVSVHVHTREGRGRGYEWGHLGREGETKNAWEKPPFRQWAEEQSSQEPGDGWTRERCVTPRAQRENSTQLRTEASREGSQKRTKI